MIKHRPVLLNEVLKLSEKANPKVFLDCTVGLGGHARAILERFPETYLIGIDRDEETLEIAKENLKPFEGRFSLYKANFTDLDLVLEEEGLKEVDAVLMDLGVSMLQLKTERGFSFQREDPLDMRMDKSQSLTAYKVVNEYSEKDLIRILRDYGEERFAKRISKAIVKRRKEKPIETTKELAQIIWEVYPPKLRYAKIHPATKTFQAIRIEVNRELQNLQEALPKALSKLSEGGLMMVISFHSLEDRIVKRTFKEWEAEGKVEILTKKPIVPSEEEVKENPPSRSAKLRCVRKI